MHCNSPRLFGLLVSALLVALHLPAQQFANSSK